MSDSANRPVASPAAPGELTPEQIDLIDRLATRIVAVRMSVPAILFMESSRPLSFLGSQMLYFLEPFVRAVVKGDQYRLFAGLMEDRANVERMLRAIEFKEAEVQETERLARQAKKQRAAEEKARRRNREERTP